jgi:hypothetical protein
MVLAASSRDALTITVTDLKEAEKQVSALERDMVKVFESIGVAQGARSANEVVILVRNHKQIKNTALWKQLFATMEQKTYVDSINAAVAAGQIRREKLDDGDYMFTYTGGK